MSEEIIPDLWRIRNLIVAAVPEVVSKSKFTGREKEVGSSEVGLCLRRTVYRKLNPSPFDTASAGKVLRGKGLENSAVQIIRTAYPGKVKATGHNQKELRHPQYPLVCHPDGVIEIDGIDASLEIKTTDRSGLDKMRKKGLPVWYEDQATAQAGLMGLPGTYLFAFNASDLCDVEAFWVPFDEARYNDLLQRADRIMCHVAEETLPAGEPDRSFGCQKCELRNDCEAYTLRLAEPSPDGPDAILQADLSQLLEEIAELEQLIARPAAEIEALKKRVKELMARGGLTEFDCGAVRAKLTPTTRETFDSTRFKAEQADTYAKYLKSSTSLTLTVKWGEA